jgi:hypothetical protein
MLVEHKNQTAMMKTFSKLHNMTVHGHNKVYHLFEPLFND